MTRIASSIFTLAAVCAAASPASAAQGVLVALSVTQVGGELVLRAEDELVHGTFRDACQAYGFTTITWVDPWTPLT